MGLSEPTLMATCDYCEESVELRLTTMGSGGSYDERNVEHDLERMGWVYYSGNNLACDQCKATIELNRIEQEHTDQEAEPWEGLEVLRVPQPTNAVGRM